MNSCLFTGTFVIWLACSVRPACGASLIANGDFSDSINGWEKIGTVFDTGELAVLLAFEFIDGNGLRGDSTGAVDNVLLEAVFIPEPNTGCMVLACGVLLRLRRRRCRILQV